VQSNQRHALSYGIASHRFLLYVLCVQDISGPTLLTSEIPFLSAPYYFSRFLALEKESALSSRAGLEADFQALSACFVGWGEKNCFGHEGYTSLLNLFEERPSGVYPFNVNDAYEVEGLLPCFLLIWRGSPEPIISHMALRITSLLSAFKSCLSDLISDEAQHVRSATSTTY
jgi:hypothetical protein